MATISIPWNNGPGNIVLTYTGQGNESVVVTSDTDNYEGLRQQTVTFVVEGGAIRHEVASSEGNLLRTADGHILRTLDNQMKVKVTVIQNMSSLHVLVSASDHSLLSASGNILRSSTPSN